MRLRKVVTPGYRHSVYSNGSDTGIFMSTYLGVLSLQLLQSFQSSFLGFASFSSFLISLLLFAFRMYVFLLICRRLLSWSLVSGVYASRRFIPVVQESQITFFLSSLFFYLLIFPSSSCTLYPQFRSSSSVTESISVLSL
jgi:uncharacterized membrane protein